MWRFFAVCASSRDWPGMFEIGAGILPVRVEEKVVQARVEIVVAGDVCLGAPAIVALVQAAERNAGLLERLDPRQRFERGEVPGAQFEKS